MRYHPELSASWMENLVPDFLRQRGGDFERLQDSEAAFGPGPLLLLFNFPEGIDAAEVNDVVDDVAPVAQRNGFFVYRIGRNDPCLDLSLQEALESIVAKTIKQTAATEPLVLANEQDNPTTVLFFSGFDNQEMMKVYNTLGREVYLETSLTPACAKAVPSAMSKNLRQVLTEISGDHNEAVSSEDEVQQ